MLNISVVFVISGVWHGANWTFIVWGVIHAMLYFVERLLKPLTARVKEASRIKQIVFRIVSVGFTFHAVLLAWVFFRAETLSDGVTVIQKIATELTGKIYIGSSSVEFGLSALLIATLCVIELLQYLKLAPFYGVRGRLHWAWAWGGTLSLAIAILLFGKSNSDFIYFQF